MKWEEVRRTYPDQYIKLQILESHMEGNKKYIDELAVIEVMDDCEEATKELVKTEGNTLVYHTGNENLFIEVKNIRGYRGES
ncbi:MAG: hypothetical protein GX895_13130 [Clostridiales bacterium]|uniref:hypothetical protein n=1 Tax=Clostridium sp. N3C TaxID=1776758 RepID=UPI00092DF34F|nr:hypothetical protein [Clostridium sp. N3C]NLZ49693.1 hypothetical protein [Clostridiales bacterium]SCN25979.1 hypothetical protein N3C_2615 [Clostridium sp. N3C]